MAKLRGGDANQHEESISEIIGGVWENAKCFFIDEESRRKAWMLAIINLVLLAIDNAIMVSFSYIQKDYSTALQEKNEDGFYTGIMRFVGIILMIIPITCIGAYVGGCLINEWRAYLTRKICGEYFKNRRFYQMQLVKNGIDNPDQRISSDIGSFVNTAASLAQTLISSAMTLVSFATVLYSISPKACLFLILYAAFGTFVTLKVFGMPLTKIARSCLQEEADFRYSLVRVRENAEAVALYRGEQQEQATTVQLFDMFMKTMYRQLAWGTNLTAFRKCFNFCLINCKNLM